MKAGAPNSRVYYDRDPGYLIKRHFESLLNRPAPEVYLIYESGMIGASWSEALTLK